MSVLPLFVPTPVADAWHRVSAPGGYEWWYFDAESEDGSVQLVATFFEGYVFHPGYLRAYARYRRRPTRRRPPVAGEYPCVSVAVYERERVLAKFMTQYPPAEFQASDREPRVRIGPNSMRADADDAGHRLHLEGIPWRLTWRGPGRDDGAALSADLTFRPTFAHPPQERALSSRGLAGAEHQWVIASPHCVVSGTLRLPTDGVQRPIDFRGRGYHDHHYGTGPIGAGLRRWAWGRVLTADRALTFQLARPEKPSLPEVHLVEVSPAGVRVVGVRDVDVEWSGQSSLLLAYPRRLRMDATLTLENPRVIDSSPYYVSLAYDARLSGGHQGTAFCGVAYPHRLRWPVLGRMVEMSIHRVNAGPVAAPTD